MLCQMYRALCRWAAVALIVLSVRPALACSGDCNGDGEVTIDELILGVNIALENAPTLSCAAFDGDHSGTVTIDEIVGAVNVALTGCPATATPSPARSATPTPTATLQATATATPSPTINHAPVVTPKPIYRTYPDYPIHYTLPVGDPDNDPLTCSVGSLPEGAVYDASARALVWAPSSTQVGPAYVDFQCEDDASPPAEVVGRLAIKVQRPSACVVPTCDPATGCVDELIGLDHRCCDQGPVAPVEEPLAGCPEGLVLFAGGDLSGFGELGQCYTKSVLNSAQSAASIRFNLRTSCIYTDDLPRFRIVVETASRIAVRDKEVAASVKRTPEGWYEKNQVPWAIDGGGPFFDLEGAEANVTLSIRDAQNQRYTQKLRVRLTFTPIPDVGDPGEPRPTITATLPRPTATPTPHP